MKNGAKTRQVRLGMETLERRELLSGGVSTLAVSNDPGRLSPVRRLEYKTPSGSHVIIQLFGAGELDVNETTVDPDGGLNLRFSGTNQLSGIVATVHGGNGHAPLRTLQSLDLPTGSLSGVGSSLINIVNLKDFDLVPGGRINLTGGVHDLSLNSIAADTQVSLREVPENSTTVMNSAGTATQTVPGISVSTNGGSSNSITAGGGSSSGSSSSSSGNSNSTAPVLATATTRNGVTLSYSIDSSFGQTLSSVNGTFVPGNNVVFPNITPGSPNPQPGGPPAPPGVVISINRVNGPARDNQLLGHADVFGYDPTAGALIRFDTVTGAPLQTIPVALSNPNAEAGVALASVNGLLLVLISDGSNVYAFNANTGASVGQFSLTNLKASTGLANPTRLGTFDTTTVIADPTGGANGLGLIQPIDVAQSLSTGSAVPLLGANGNPVPPYSMTRAFGLAGGLSGVPGSNTLFATGGAHFDPFQPNQFQLGVASLNASGGSLRETTRTVVTGSNNSTILTNAFGASLSGASLNDALGSIDQNLALFTGQVATPSGAMVDQVSLINPSSFAKVGTVVLNDPNPLSGLSGSFRPAIAGAALVDVQGNTQSFKAKTAQGLIFNGEGNVNLVKINSASQTTILGYPFGHAEIPNRSDVTIVSSTRSVGDRNGVVVLSNIRPTGPLSLPTP